jgi:alanine racemase
MRPTWADIDVDAITRNVERLRARIGAAALCAVVKADGYGHGAVAAARAAQRGGATWLAVALVEEGIELRDAGIDGPILLLSEPRPTEMREARNAQLRLTLYSSTGVAAAIDASRDGDEPWPVHLKVDTGMHRVGCSPLDVCALVDHIASSPSLRLEGVFTHCAVADELDDPFTATQLDRFDEMLEVAGLAGRPDLVLHAGNSAVGLAHPRGHHHLVRFGIAIYGIAPSSDVPLPDGSEPALTLRTEVSHVQMVAPGEGVSYGRRWIASRPTRVATIPIGYADGIRRDLPARGGEVLVHGVRRPMIGVVTMDQLMFDCGDVEVAVGDEVVLIGTQGDERINAEEVADHLGTIGYEIVCGIGARVPRRVRGATT